MKDQVNLAGAERHIAERVRFELAARNWSPERLATEVTAHGVPMKGHAVRAILGENVAKPRRINANELLAFAAVFGTDVKDMLVPLSKVADDLIAELGESVEQSVEVFEESWDAMVRAWLDFREMRGRRDLVYGEMPAVRTPKRRMFPTFDVEDHRVGACERASNAYQRDVRDLEELVSRFLGYVGIGSMVERGEMPGFNEAWSTWDEFERISEEFARSRGEEITPFARELWRDEWERRMGYQVPRGDDAAEDGDA